MIYRFFSKKTLGLLLTVFFLSAGCQDKGGAVNEAPDFRLADLDGDFVTLGDYLGKVVILDFWATWCRPCRMAIPEMTRLQDMYRDEGLVVLGISLDDPSRFNNEYLRAFKEKFDMNYKLLRYNTDILKQYFPDTRPAIPTLFIVDREGMIQGKIVGYRPDILENAIKEVMS